MSRSPTTITLALAVICGLPALGQEQPPQGLQQEVRSLRQELEAGRRREEELRARISVLDRKLEEVIEDRRAEPRRGTPESAAATELEARIADLEVVASGPGASSSLSVGGYFDFAFRHDQAESHPTFEQHRFNLQFKATVIPDAITFKAELEIEGGGAGVDHLTDNEIALEYAEIHFHIDETFNVKLGALLVPFNRFNYLHDSPLQDLQDRPLVDRRVVPTTWTEAGVGIYGLFDLDGIDIDYDIIVANGLDDDFSGTPGGGFRDSRSSLREDENGNKMVIGRLGLRPEIGFLDAAYVGTSFAIGTYDDEDEKTIRGIGVDWFFRLGAFELSGEFADFDLERDAATAPGIPGGASGYYLQLAYHFFPESWRGLNAFFGDESTFTLVFRFDSVDTDDSATGIDRAARGDGFRDDRLRYTIGLNFRPVEKSVFRIEYQFFVERDGIAGADNDRFVISFASYF